MLLTSCQTLRKTPARVGTSGSCLQLCAAVSLMRVNINSRLDATVLHWRIKTCCTSSETDTSQALPLISSRLPSPPPPLAVPPSTPTPHISCSCLNNNKTFSSLGSDDANFETSTRKHFCVLSFFLLCCSAGFCVHEHKHISTVCRSAYVEIQYKYNNT